ncbi:adenylyltransferase and sulfurtransferase [Soonwooa buanensis]|uniref:Molybdopterin-synthase adenylyltransferase n=1 Tax=Soonwooa buanensis TaxID=619805 RepID=A0A1T5CNM1_9FLAO|nr:HesA/MoeB/ThiF family protein [Soonwooa buanensis]SKB61049.1 adenylyltransferase and sulfurtransferase [Soonwooa buanensis]
MEEQFSRYQCQMALPGFGIEAQKRLQNAKVLVVGIGGLGCPSSQYLAASGIGTLAIVDDDVVSLSNLHRQILYTPEDVGKPKVEVAAKRLQAQNPSITIIPINQRVTSDNVMDLIADYDLVIEGTDNFETKYLLNDACVLAGKALVYGAIYQYEGQVSIWNVQQADGSFSANYRDVFPDVEAVQVPNCAEGGVIPSLAGIVGCMQANEAIKYLTQSKDLLADKLWMVNMLMGKTQIIKLRKSNAIEIKALVETIPIMSFNEFNTKKDQLEIIDVREISEHEASNLGGKNIPLSELENRLSEITPDKTILCYCASGKRSTVAVGILKKHFPNISIFSLKNGMSAY